MRTAQSIEGQEGQNSSDSTTPSGSVALATSHTPKTASVDIVVPVYNEEKDLENSIRALRAYLDRAVPWNCNIIIADNASTDSTPNIAATLTADVDRVRSIRIPKKGRGRALKQTWMTSTADVVVYMDVDLSTDLSALLPLIAPLISGHSDIAIGTRLTRSSRVTRGPKREIISRCYNFLIRSTVGAHFSDAQCGFKAMRTDAAHKLLPLVKDNEWFFDTETLILAERAGMRIHEVPVDWTDDPNSTVDIISTATEDIKGLWRVGTGLATGKIPIAALRSEQQSDGGQLDGEQKLDANQKNAFRQLITFGCIGVASTIAFAILYLLFRPLMGAQLANALTLVITAIGNTAANRHLTFNSASRDTAVRDHASGLVLMLIAWAITSGSLAALGVLFPGASHAVEVTVLIAANLLATIIRFVGLKAVTSR